MKLCCKCNNEVIALDPYYGDYYCLECNIQKTKEDLKSFDDAINNSLNEQFEERCKPLRDRAIKAENQLRDLYFILNPQYGEPTEPGYYVVWPNEDMKYPIGLAECRRGPNGGYRKMRWLEPEKHGEFNWNHEDWHWTRLPEK